MNIPANNAIACQCADCAGATCTCGCQAAPTAPSACGCGCNAGHPCRCGEARA